MARVRPDIAQHLRAVWLGPKGARLPFEWTYGQLFLAFCLWIPASAITGLIQVALTGIPLLFFAGPFGFGPPIALVLTTLAMKGVSEDEPLGYRLAMFAGKLKRRPAVPTETVTITFTHPRITSTPPGVVRALTGINPAPTTTIVKETHVEPHQAPAIEKVVEPVIEAPVFEPAQRIVRPRRAAQVVELDDEFRPEEEVVTPKRAAS